MQPMRQRAPHLAAVLRLERQGKTCAASEATTAVHRRQRTIGEQHQLNLTPHTPHAERGALIEREHVMAPQRGHVQHFARSHNHLAAPREAQRTADSARNASTSSARALTNIGNCSRSGCSKSTWPRVSRTRARAPSITAAHLAGLRRGMQVGVEVDVLHRGGREEQEHLVAVELRCATERA